MKKTLMALSGLALLVNLYAGEFLGIYTNVDYKQKDKVLHAGISFALVPTFDLIYLHKLPSLKLGERFIVSYLSTLGVGAGKEFYDKYIKGNDWSDLDMEANFYGATTGLIITPLMDKLWKHICSKTIDGGIKKSSGLEEKINKTKNEIQKR